MARSWLLPLLLLVPAAAGLPGGPCIGVCVATETALDPVIDGALDLVGTTVDSTSDVVQQAVGEPAATHAAPPAPTPKQRVLEVAAATPWWMALGASLAALAGMLWPFWHAPAAGLFSRIRRDRVLDHPTRQTAIDLLAAQPGLAVRELAERAGVSWQTMRGHLRRLEGHGLVVSQRSGKRRLYFAQGSEAAAVRGHVAALRSTPRRRLARTVAAQPGLDQATLCQRLGMRNPTASKHLARLREAGLVEAAIDGRRRTYTPTARLQDALGCMGSPGAFPAAASA